MKKTSILIHDYEHLDTGVFGKGLTSIQPFKRVLEHVNQLGLEGYKVETMEFYSDLMDITKDQSVYDRFSQIDFYSSRVSIAHYDDHGQGD